MSHFFKCDGCKKISDPVRLQYAKPLDWRDLEIVIDSRRFGYILCPDCVKKFPIESRVGSISHEEDLIAAMFGMIDAAIDEKINA